MNARLQITPHAVEQYQRRWAPESTVEESRLVLLAAAPDACATKERTPKGDQIWRLGPVRLVVKRDHGGAAPVVVTILGPEDTRSGVLPFDGDTDDAGDTRRMLEWSLRDAERETKERLESMKVACRAFEAARKHEAQVRTRVGELGAVPA